MLGLPGLGGFEPFGCVDDSVFGRPIYPREVAENLQGKERCTAPGPEGMVEGPPGLGSKVRRTGAYMLSS